MPKISKSDSTVVAAATAPVKAVAATKAPKVAAAATTTTAPATKAPKVAAAAEPSSAEQPPKKKTKSANASAPVAAAVAPVVAATDDSAVAVDANATINTDFSEFLTKLQLVSSMLSSLKTDFRSLEKKSTRELKSASKAGAKRKRKTGNRSPSGFVKPTLISADLATFLGKPAGSEMARTEVTREINKYIRENELQDKANGRKINADVKLAALLKIDTTKEELTYFNLQRYMSPHFAKKDVAAVAPVVASA